MRTLSYSVGTSALVLCCLACPSLGSEILVDSFESLEPWGPHDDGGHSPALQLDAEFAVEGHTGMRLVYHDEPPHWGNIARLIEVPPATVSLGLSLYKHSSAPGAAMHCWLMEKDGDAWVAPILPGGQAVGAVRPGWYSISIPVASFRFEARGPGSRDMPSAVRLLLGCNYGDLEVTVDRLTLEIRDGALSDEPPNNPDYAPERGDRGTAVILGGDLPRSAGASDPEALAGVLRQSGWGASVVLPGDLPRVLEPGSVDVLVVAGGPAFPADAVPALRAFLAAGGDLLTIGGYAFDEPVTYAGGEWRPAGAGVTAAELSAGSPSADVRVNSRMGTHGDTMGFDPQQLQVFDPSFLLKRVAGARAASEQMVIPADLRIAGSLEGYAAVSTLGSNSPVFPDLWGRRIPLIETFDAFGRPRGAAGAIVHHFAGPYLGSSWAFFGVTNRDLFTGDDAPLGAALPRLMDALTHPRYIRRVATGQACYRPGESVTVEGEVWLEGDEVDVHVAVTSPLLGSLVAEVLPSSTTPGLRTFAVTVDSPDLSQDYATVRAELVLAGQVVDSLETAFVVWSPEVISGGPSVSLDGSRLIIDGRHHLRLGTNQTGFVWYSEHEDPKVWDADFRAMRDHQIRIVRLLHFSAYSEGGYKGQPSNRPEALQYRPEKLCRQTDALVQLAQKHGIVLFLTLHDWMPVALTEEQYQAQEDWNRFWVERYRDVPGIIYDIQNEPDVGDPPAYPNLVALYNGMLAERYGTPERLRQAWGLSELPGEWSALPIQQGSGQWTDVVSHDYWLFKMRVYNHWVERNAQGIMAGDPDALFTVGHLISNTHADKQLGAAHVPFTNTHYYGDLVSFGEYLKYSDRLTWGKPLSVGEFGAQEAHDQRTTGGDGTRDEASIQRYVWYAHASLGLDASFLCSWSWKDFEGAVFPWGMRYLQDPVSKDVLLVHRAQGLALSSIDLPPIASRQVFVVTPDCHRLGPMFGQIEGALNNVFRTLYELGVPFGLLTEGDLVEIPASTRALIWPVPYCASDETLDRLEAWVETGGALYLSGSIAFDECRRIPLGARGGRFGIERYPTQPPDSDASGSAVPIVRSPGTGLVHFVPAPVELRSPDALRPLYRGFLTQAGIAPAGNDGPVQALRPSPDGPLVLLNAQSEPALARCGGVEAEMPAAGALLMQLGPTGVPQVVHAHSSVALNGRVILAGVGETFLWSLTGAPLNEGPGALLYPIAPGELRMPVLRRNEVLTAEVGDLVEGRWIGFESRTLQPTAQGPGLDVPAEWALSLVLVYPSAQRDAAVEAVEALAAR